LDNKADRRLARQGVSDDARVDDRCLHRTIASVRDHDRETRFARSKFPSLIKKRRVHGDHA
jgi:hypothetical protein